jgi:hypothetical protein
MRNQSRSIGRKFQQKLGLWLLLISAGVVAYGLGMWQGSQFRMNRMIASISKPVVAAELTATPSAFVGPLNTPSSTESLKKHSK